MSYLETAKSALKDCEHKSLEGSPRPVMPTTTQVAEMRLDALSRAGVIVRIHSEVLDGSVVFASDTTPDDLLEEIDLPVYRVAELRKLVAVRASPELLKWSHEVKRLFGGVVESAA